MSEFNGFHYCSLCERATQFACLYLPLPDDVDTEQVVVQLWEFCANCGARWFVCPKVVPIELARLLPKSTEEAGIAHLIVVEVPHWEDTETLREMARLKGCSFCPRCGLPTEIEGALCGGCLLAELERT